MAMFIDSDECTGCGDCKPVCPTRSIRVSNGLYVIDGDTCNECEDSGDPQCLGVCPIDYCIQPL